MNALNTGRRWKTSTTIIILTAISVIAVAALTVAVIAMYTSSQEANNRAKQLQDAFCGLVVPVIGQPSSTVLGQTLVLGADHAAQVIHCPLKGN